MPSDQQHTFGPLTLRDTLDPSKIVCTAEGEHPAWTMWAGGGFYAEATRKRHPMTGDERWDVEVMSDLQVPPKWRLRPWFNSKYTVKRKPSTTQIKRYARTLARSNGYA